MEEAEAEQWTRGGEESHSESFAWEPGRTEQLGMHCDTKYTPNVQLTVQSLQRWVPGHGNWCQLSTSPCFGRSYIHWANIYWPPWCTGHRETDIMTQPQSSKNSVYWEKRDLLYIKGRGRMIDAGLGPSGAKIQRWKSPAMKKNLGKLVTAGPALNLGSVSELTGKLWKLYQQWDHWFTQTK